MNKISNKIIFQWVKKNNWSPEYSKINKKHDFKYYLFNTLQLKSFVKLFFQNYGLTLINLKFFYKNKNLSFFILYNKKFKLKKQFIFKNYFSNIIKSFKQFFFLNLFKTHFKLHYFYNLNKNLNNYLKFLYLISRKINNYSNLFLNCYKTIKFLKKQKIASYFKKIKMKTFYLKYSNLLYTKQLQIKRTKNYFLKYFFLIITHFFNTNINILLITKQFNNNSVINLVEKYKLLINIVNLKKFQNTAFFKSTINLLFYCLYNKCNLAYILSKFLSYKLAKFKSLKNTNIFLDFFINSVYYLLLFKKIQKFELYLKGNLNKNKRSIIKKFILEKKISKIKINQNFNFENSTVYSKKGTFGIKVCIN